MTTVTRQPTAHFQTPASSDSSSREMFITVGQKRVSLFVKESYALTPYPRDSALYDNVTNECTDEEYPSDDAATDALEDTDTPMCVQRRTRCSEAAGRSTSLDVDTQVQIQVAPTLHINVNTSATEQTCLTRSQSDSCNLKTAVRSW